MPSRRALSLPLKQTRFEISIVGIAGAIVVVASVAIALYLRSLSPGPLCLQGFWLGGGATPPECGDASTFLAASRELGDKVMLVMLVFPALAGRLIGSSIMATEIEDGVAAWTWPMANLRIRWLLFRLAPLGALALGIAIVVGLATEVLAQQMTPWLDASQSFRDYGLRGVLVPVRVFVALAVGLSFGALLGRSMRAFIVASIVALSLLLALSLVRPFGQPYEALPDDTGTGARFDLTLGSRFLHPDGRALTVDEAVTLAPDQTDAEAAFQWARSQFPYVVLGVPGERAPEVVFRETVILLGAGGAFLLLAVVVLQRRRPY